MTITSTQVAKITSVDFEVVKGAEGNTCFQGIVNDAVDGTSNIGRVFAIGADPVRFKLRNPKFSDWSTQTNTSTCVEMRYYGTITVSVMVHYAVRSALSLP